MYDKNIIDLKSLEDIIYEYSFLRNNSSNCNVINFNLWINEERKPKTHTNKF